MPAASTARTASSVAWAWASHVSLREMELLPVATAASPARGVLVPRLGRTRRRRWKPSSEPRERRLGSSSSERESFSSSKGRVPMRFGAEPFPR